MMDDKLEKEFATNIARTLDWGMSQIEADKLSRLHAARQKAMVAYREPVTILGMVTVSGHTLNMANWIRKHCFGYLF